MNALRPMSIFPRSEHPYRFTKSCVSVIPNQLIKLMLKTSVYVWNIFFFQIMLNPHQSTFIKPFLIERKRQSD